MKKQNIPLNIKNCKEQIDFENSRINKVQNFKYLGEVITTTNNRKQKSTKEKLSYNRQKL